MRGCGFVLAKLTVEYMQTKKRVCHETLACAQQLISCTLDCIETSTTSFAVHCRNLCARNKVNATIDQHSDDSTVLDTFVDTFVSKESCTAFLANLETLGLAMEMLLTTKPDELFLSRDEGLMFLRNEMQTLHLASFDDTPRIGQARIFKAQFSRFELSVDAGLRDLAGGARGGRRRCEITRADVQEHAKHDARQQQQLKEEKERSRLRAKTEKKKSRKLRKAASAAAAAAAAAACAAADISATGEPNVTYDNTPATMQTAGRRKGQRRAGRRAGSRQWNGCVDSESVPVTSQHRGEDDEEVAFGCAGNQRRRSRASSRWKEFAPRMRLRQQLTARMKQHQMQPDLLVQSCRRRAQQRDEADSSSATRRSSSATRRSSSATRRSSSATPPGRRRRIGAQRVAAHARH